MYDPQNEFKGVQLIGVGDAATIMGVRTNHIRKLIYEKKLPYQKVSNGYVLPKKAILDFQKKRKEKAKNDPRIKL